jgi:membrane dipeptidase
MRRTLLLPLLVLLGCAAAQARTDDPHLEVARRVLATTPLVDGHNDLPWAIRTYRAAPRNVAAYDLRGRAPGHTDIPRLREGMVGVQFWSVYVPSSAVADGAARVQLEQIDIARQVMARYPDVFEETLTADAALAAFRRGRIASVMGMEGGHVLENSLGALRMYYELGVRYLTLTHSDNTDWADAATDLPRHNGLTAFGMEVVREMNRLGMLVDLSHVATRTMHDALDVSEAPVIFSHSSARAVTDHLRNVPDDVLRRMRANGGIVMVTFVPDFVNDAVARYWRLPPEERADTPAPRATMDDVIRHLEHVRDVAGIDHVGLGGDFDGITRVPVGLEDVSTYPALFAELSRRGWSEAELRKLAGENALRVWREAERVAQRLQRERGPSVATIEQLDGHVQRPANRASQRRGARR